MHGMTRRSFGIACLLVTIMTSPGARAEDAILTFIGKVPNGQVILTRNDIANYLRLASESVSRGFRRLQDAKLVAVDRREIELLDLPRLEHMAASILRG